METPPAGREDDNKPEPQNGVPVTVREGGEPPLDEWDWFKLSRAWMTGADQRITDQANSVVEAVKWVFGLTTSSLVVGLLWDKLKVSAPSLMVMGAAVLFFFLSYYYATRAKMSRAGFAYLPSSPKSIIATYVEGNKRANRRIHTASGLLMLGMILIPLALALPKVQDKSEAVNRDSSFCAAEINGSRPGTDTVSWSGLAIEYRLPSNDSLELTLFHGTSPERATPILRDRVPSDTTHAFQYGLRFRTQTLFNDTSLILLLGTRERHGVNRSIIAQVKFLRPDTLMEAGKLPQPAKH